MKNLRKLIEKDPHLKGVNKVLLASSGGIDSMCLASLLKEAEIPFDIAHMNYQLRSVDSNNDQQFLLEWCWSKDVNFHTKTVSVDTSSGNVQQMARDLRYSWLRSLVEKHNYTLILTAHHANDLVEGAFLKLWRGVEWEDRYLMPEMYHKIYRPLLAVYRSEIEEWVKSNSIPFVEDESNKSAEKYDRNFLRLQILKSFEKRRPGSIQLFNEKIRQEEDQRKLYHWMVQEIGKGLIEKKGSNWVIDLEKVKRMDSPNADTLLTAILKSQGISIPIADQIMSSSTGANWATPIGTLWLDREKLIFKPDQQTDPNRKGMTVEQSGIYHIAHQCWQIEPMKYIPPEELDRSQLFLEKSSFPFPWTIRNWAFGDTMAPLGMRGSHKKLKDIFIDQKIPRPDKRSVLFLEVRDEIIWIPGIKKSEKLKDQKVGRSGWLITVTNVVGS